MSAPIAKARHVPARPRRRWSVSPPLRTALALALVGVCVLALPRLLDSVRSQPAPPGPVPVAAGRPPLGGLESGACRSYAPTAGSLDRTVFLDPGHGGLDPGVVGTAGGQTVEEKDVALGVAGRLSSMLRGDGYRVVMSRTTDSTVTRMSPSDVNSGGLTAAAEHRDLLARAACANAASASVLVSIHFDGFDDPSVGGTETFYDAARPFGPDSKRLAVDLQAALVTGLGTSDRGVWTDDQLNAPTLTASGSQYGHLIELGPAQPGWVDDPSRMAGALVEPLFLTHPEEARFAADPRGQERIAAAMATGLQRYFAGG